MSLERDRPRDTTPAMVARAVLVVASVVVCLDCTFGPSPDGWDVWGRTEGERRAARQLRESGVTASKVAGCGFAVGCIWLALLPPAHRRGASASERNAARSPCERKRPGDTVPGRLWRFLNRPRAFVPLVRLVTRRPR